MPTFSLLHRPDRLPALLLPMQDAPLPYLSVSQASVVSFSPVYLRRRVTRLVSCYALFK